MPRLMSFSDAEQPDPPRIDGRIRRTGGLLDRRLVEDGDERSEIRAHLSLFGASRYEILYRERRLILDATSMLDLVGNKESFARIEFHGERPAALADNLLMICPGSIVAGESALVWHAERGRPRLLVGPSYEESYLVATKPWQDSELHTEWTFEWLQRPSDDALRLALLLSPWAASILHTRNDRSGSFP